VYIVRLHREHVVAPPRTVIPYSGCFTRCPSHVNDDRIADPETCEPGCISIAASESAKLKVMR